MNFSIRAFELAVIHSGRFRPIFEFSTQFEGPLKNKFSPQHEFWATAKRAAPLFTLLVRWQARTHRFIWLIAARIRFWPSSSSLHNHRISPRYNQYLKVTAFYSISLACLIN